jgi:hypothetical protein
LVLETLQSDEGAVLARVGIGGGEDGTTLLVAEEVVAWPEIAHELRLEHAAILVDECIVGVKEHVADDQARVDDLGIARSGGLDGEQRGGR